MIDGAKLTGLKVWTLSEEDRDVVCARFDLLGNFLVEDRRDDGLELNFHETVVNVHLTFSSLKELTVLIGRVKSLVKSNMADRKDFEDLAKKATEILGAEFGEGDK